MLGSRLDPLGSGDTAKHECVKKRWFYVEAASEAVWIHLDPEVEVYMGGHEGLVFLGCGVTSTEI